MKINNHFFPYFHIKKWENIDAKLYNKSTDKIRKINRLDFSKKRYYEIDGTDELENRISKFENYISVILKKIDSAENQIDLTGKELYLLKLYCAFCSYRHQFTSEVIVEDDFGMYHSNNYLWGVYRHTEINDVLNATKNIIEVFEKIIKDSQFDHLEEFTRVLPSEKMIKIGHPTLAFYGLHLVILRNSDNWFCVSNRCAIIENTLDSDYLYTYVPISPKSALLLVKTKYFLDKETYDYSRARLSYKNGGYKPDPYLSVIFGSCGTNNVEGKLFCSYYKPYVISNVHVGLNYLPNRDYSNVKLIIHEIENQIVDNFNAIFYQDGIKFIFSKDLILERAKTIVTDYRHIKGMY